jgi:hypothetical protein
MRDEKDLGKELLKRNGIEPAEEFRETLREVAALLARDRMARDRARARRATWVAVLSLLVVVVLYFGRKGLVTRGLLDSLIVNMGIFVVCALCILALAVAVPIWIGASSPGDGIAAGEVPEKRRAELYRIAERDKNRERTAKLGAVFGCVSAWATVVVIGTVRGGLDAKEVVLLLFAGLALFPVQMAVLLWFIGMFFGQRQIQRSLADIAEQLRQLATDQQADRPKPSGTPAPEPESETKSD